MKPQHLSIQALGSADAHPTHKLRQLRHIIDPDDLRNREAGMKPGTAVKVSSLRDGTPFHTDVVLARRPEMRAVGATDRG